MGDNIDSEELELMEARRDEITAITEHIKVDSTLRGLKMAKDNINDEAELDRLIAVHTEARDENMMDCLRTSSRVNEILEKLGYDA